MLYILFFFPASVLATYLTLTQSIDRHVFAAASFRHQDAQK